MTDFRIVPEAEVSRILGVSIITLRKWRCTGRGPAFLKLGANGAVRYAMEDVADWIDSNRKRSTAEYETPDAPNNAEEKPSR